MKKIIHDLNHGLTFYCIHNQLCVPQYKVMFRVLGIYNFAYQVHIVFADFYVVRCIVSRNLSIRMMTVAGYTRSGPAELGGHG